MSIREKQITTLILFIIAAFFVWFSFFHFKGGLPFQKYQSTQEHQPAQILSSHIPKEILIEKNPDLVTNFERVESDGSFHVNIDFNLKGDVRDTFELYKKILNENRWNNIQANPNGQSGNVSVSGELPKQKIMITISYNPTANKNVVSINYFDYRSVPPASKILYPTPGRIPKDNKGR